MSTSRMSWVGPQPKLNQSSDSTYMTSHLFSAMSPSHQSHRDDDMYLTRVNPQRLTTQTSATPPSALSGVQTPKPTDTYQFYLNTPYKPPVSQNDQKSPSIDLPPIRSIHEVIAQPTGYADTSMGDADTSFGGADGRGSDARALTTYNPDQFNRIDWENDTKGGAYTQGYATTQHAYATPQGYTATQGPFAGAGAFSASMQGTPGAARPYYAQTPPAGAVGYPGQLAAQSPPFARLPPQPDSKLDQNAPVWLTVFGFPPNQAASSFVLKQFQEIVDVIEYQQPVGTNWLHICCANRAHADRALVKNGKLMGEHMIGVVPRPVDTTGKEALPTVPNTISAKDPNKIYDRNAVLIPPKDQSWFKSIVSFTFG